MVIPDILYCKKYGRKTYISKFDKLTRKITYCCYRY